MRDPFLFGSFDTRVGLIDNDLSILYDGIFKVFTLHYHLKGLYVTLTVSLLSSEQPIRLSHWKLLPVASL
ncbi:hypothetical protein Hanom_Chr07g00636051 [Helianthus anomalus]